MKSLLSTVIDKATHLTKVIKHRHTIFKMIRRYFYFTEHSGQSMWGSISKKDEEGIKHAVEISKKYTGPMLELGTLFGHTTCLMATLKNKDVPLITVDNFSWNPFDLSARDHKIITERTLRYLIDHCNTQLFDGTAEDFYLKNSKMTPRMVFIDAGHSYNFVKKDIQWALERGCPVISGHDYTDKHPGVIRAVNEAFGDKISLHGSVWVHHHTPLDRDPNRTCN